MTTSEKIECAKNPKPLIAHDDLYSRLYPFTTENIAAYLDYFSLNDKSLLTVGSSCDQAINASLAGCRDITVIDLCPFTKEYYYLKRASIDNLSLKEFKNFLMIRKNNPFMKYNNQTLNRKTFRNISDHLEELDSDSLRFWRELLICHSPLYIRNQNFNSDEYCPKTISYINPYLHSESSYKATRKSLASTTINFINDDIRTHQGLGHYDNIFLSNLTSFLSLEETKQLLDYLLPHLNPNGQILLGYLYEVESQYYSIYDSPEIYSLADVHRTISKDVDRILIPSVHSQSLRETTDGILVYQKKK